MSDRLSQKLRHVYSQRLHLRLTNVVQKRLIEHAEHRDDLFPLGLGDEFGNDPDVVERALCVSHAHSAMEPVDRAELSGVVVACTQWLVKREIVIWTHPSSPF